MTKFSCTLAKAEVYQTLCTWALLHVHLNRIAYCSTTPTSVLEHGLLVVFVVCLQCQGAPKILRIAFANKRCLWVIYFMVLTSSWQHTSLQYPSTAVDSWCYQSWSFQLSQGKKEGAMQKLYPTILTFCMNYINRDYLMAWKLRYFTY